MNIRIALAGNPNCGKTTMFNALTGANQYVGNWPGVTVEKKEGRVRGRKGDEITVTDLPGIYSLSPYTLEEVVSRNYLLQDEPDVIIDLVDATNIERNLYLTTQLLETGIPVVIALNMADLVEKRGLRIDTKRLSMVLGCPVVETSALKKTVPEHGVRKIVDGCIIQLCDPCRIRQFDPVRKCRDGFQNFNTSRKGLNHDPLSKIVIKKFINNESFLSEY